jgi:hypothetical protein
MIGNSASFETYWDAQKNARVTKYGHGLVSILVQKSEFITSSLTPYEINSYLNEDITTNAHYHFSEIPWSEYVTGSKHTPLSSNGGKDLYQYSPLGNLNFRRSLVDQRGYSRSVRNSPRDYSDDNWSSASLQGFKNSTYYSNLYGYLPTVWGKPNNQVRLLREHKSNKFYSEDIGEYDNHFFNYGSGSVSMSLPYGNKLIPTVLTPMEQITTNNSEPSYYLNTKINNYRKLYYSSPTWVPPTLLQTRPRYWDAIYGSVFDNRLSTLLYDPTMASSSIVVPSNYVLNNIVFNENWSSGSVYRGYVSSLLLSASYSIGNYVQQPKIGTADYLQSWYVSGKSGSLELKANSKKLQIDNEELVPNVAILRSYNSNGALFTASRGDLGPVDSECYHNATTQFFNQLSCSCIVNSLECTKTCASQIVYYEYLFSITYPLVDENYTVVSENLNETKGFTVGNFLCWYNGATRFDFYQLPIVNFSIDGNIRIISVDSSNNLIFKNINKKWENNKLYKLSIFFNNDSSTPISDGTTAARRNFQSPAFFEIMLNDEYLGKFNLYNLTGYIYLFYKKYYLVPGYSMQNLLTWFGSIDTVDYSEYNIFTVRSVKTYYTLWQTAISDPYNMKYVNRFYNMSWKNQFKKLHAGTVNFGAKLFNNDQTYQQEALIVSCSDVALKNTYYRPTIYPVEKYSKLFVNNFAKEWQAFKRYFPNTAGY